MIERLKLWKFQSHKYLAIEFDPFVTCIVGETGRGKSSILRAIQWLCFNRPSGLEMVQHGKSRCRAVLHIDGHVLERIRGDRINLYRLDEKTFKAFGQNVPEEVARLVNVSEINFQTQLDSPFWLTDSAAKVSRELNAVVNLSAIDDALGNSASRVRQVKAEMDVCEQRLARAREEQTSLAGWVPEFTAAVRKLDVLDSRIVENRARIAAIASKLERARLLQAHIQRASCAKGEALALKSLAERYFAGRERLERLRSLVEDAIRWGKQCRAVVNFPTLLCDKVEKGLNRQGRLEFLIASYRHEETKLCQARKSSTEASEELNREAKECPLCGNQLPSQ
jgi:DNA repair exonuclease SbcCD ATPase subunit